MNHVYHRVLKLKLYQQNIIEELNVISTFRVTFELFFDWNKSNDSGFLSELYRF